jgi:hypothetical protein
LRVCMRTGCWGEYLNWRERLKKAAYRGKGKVVPVLLTEHHSFFDLGTRWRWVVSFTPRPLYPRERTPDTRWIGG